MSIEDQRGWIITNYEILIMPTLMPTRKGCIEKFKCEHKITNTQWKKWQRWGRYSCKKVELVFPDY